MRKKNALQGQYERALAYQVSAEKGRILAVDKGYAELDMRLADLLRIAEAMRSDVQARRLVKAEVLGHGLMERAQWLWVEARVLRMRQASANPFLVPPEDLQE